MSLITRMRKQTCVYWGLASNDSGGLSTDDFGQPQFTTGVELTVRWDDISVEFIAADGTKQLSRSQVYVGQDLDVGGMLMLGSLTDVTDEVTISENDGAFEIKRFDKIPNLRATEFLRVAYL